MPAPMRVHHKPKMRSCGSTGAAAGALCASAGALCASAGAFFSVSYIAVQYSTVLYSTLQYSTVYLRPNLERARKGRLPLVIIIHYTPIIMNISTSVF